MTRPVTEFRNDDTGSKPPVHWLSIGQLTVADRRTSMDREEEKKKKKNGAKKVKNKQGRY